MSPPCPALAAKKLERKMIRMTSSTTMTQHIFLRTFRWYLPAVRSSSTALPGVVDRLAHRVLDLIQQLALRLHQHRHVEEQLVQLRDGRFQPFDVLVPLLNVGERVARGGVAGPCG